MCPVLQWAVARLAVWEAAHTILRPKGVQDDKQEMALSSQQMSPREPRKS